MLPAGQHFLVEQSNLALSQASLGPLVRHCLFVCGLRHGSSRTGAHYGYNRLLLLLYPDFSIGWNERRRRVLVNCMTSSTTTTTTLSLLSELRFSSLVLKSYPKKPVVWAYRYWIWNKLLEQTQHLSLNGDDLIHRELELCFLTADTYKCNYQAWLHRRRIISSSLCDNSSSMKLSSSPSLLLENEISGTEKWTATHPSDSSGWSYRIWIIQKYINQHQATSSSYNSFSSSFISRLLSDEGQRILTLNSIYPGHESIWLHLSNLVSLFHHYNLVHDIPQSLVMLVDRGLTRGEEGDEEQECQRRFIARVERLLE